MGAISLLRSDPKTQGPILFQRHCASCHSHTDQDGQGIVAQEPSAPNLYGFGSHAWIAGLLNRDKIAGPHYFGTSAKASGEMVSTIAEMFAKADGEKQPAARDRLLRRLDRVAWALADEAGLPAPAVGDATRDGETTPSGRLSPRDASFWRGDCPAPIAIASAIKGTWAAA